MSLVIKNSFSTSQGTGCFYTTKISELVLFRELITVRNTKHIFERIQGF